jgi:hypothetical protein
MSIKTQITLPPQVALKVVLQGIRVRFGRSVVTVMGVALGIAFLMSILAGQVIKAGVAGEQAARNDAKRRLNTFVAEAGLPAGTVLGILQLGPLNDAESRLVRGIVDSGVGTARWCNPAGSAIPANLRASLQRCARADLGRDATAILVVGEGPATPLVLADVMQGARHRLIFTARKSQVLAPVADMKAIVLERELRPDEIAKAAVEQRKAGFRNIWIVVIALFVTVIGIANSMLMSVTERFREIGTMKCLGALSAFVRQMFLIESSLIGLAGASAGAVLGVVFSAFAYSLTYGFSLVFQSMNPVRLALYFVLCVGVGVMLSVMAALYPARFASRMLPAHALRSEV